MENKILAIVNNVQIKESDVEEAINRFPAERRSYFNSPVAREQLLEQIISYELMYNHGKELGIESSEEFLVQIEKAKKEILTQMTINSELSKITVSEEEIKEYYENNKEKFQEAEQVRAKHILVDTEEEAKSIKDQIEGGLSFEEAAQNNSKCPSASNGGDLGFFTRGRMVPEFENAAFELNVGEVSAPVQTQFGFHLIKVEEKKEASVKSFEEVEQMIGGTVLQEKQASKYYELVEELKGKFNVQMYK